jgi:hypothetical protein
MVRFLTTNRAIMHLVVRAALPSSPLLQRNRPECSLKGCSPSEYADYSLRGLTPEGKRRPAKVLWLLRRVHVIELEGLWKEMITSK